MAFHRQRISQQSITAGTASAGAYQLVVLGAAHDPVWDQFVAAQPGGEHPQASFWARLYQLQGYHVLRLVVYQLQAQGPVIVGGLQLAVRPIGLGWGAAFAEQGPLLANDDPVVAHIVLWGLHWLARQQRLAYVVLMPPRQHPRLVQLLTTSGYRSSWIGEAYVAAQRIDLRQPEAVLLKQMRRTMRQSLRQGQRKGTTVRWGDTADLPLFYVLHCQTSRRQLFAPLPYAFFERLWLTLHPTGQLVLFVAEVAEQPVSAVLVLRHGDTARWLYAGWNGSQPKHYPNEVLYWHVLQWAQRHGLHWCDLEWVDRYAAQAYTSGQLHQAAQLHSPTFFKLSLGGQVVAYAGGYEYVYLPVLGVCHRWLVPRVLNPPALRRWLQHHARRAWRQFRLWRHTLVPVWAQGRRKEPR
ncbi:MAG: GNAT family N-acetyltransferase [Chloroflexaceae bacterium]|nr:GNAT family N-acetyltransferase [Chloroflexaceae bacterium]